MKLIRKTYQAETKASGEDRTLIVKISTANPDRSNDVVMPKGVIFDNYQKNPVVAFAHNYSGLSIGKTIDIQKVDDGIVAQVEFVPKGVYPLADQLYEMYKGGFMNAWSIGFIPKKWSDRPDGGREFQEWELLEYSAVLVPDNPEALTLLRSKGIDPEPLVEESENVKSEEDVKEDKPKEEPKEEEKEEDKKTVKLEEVDKNVENPQIESIEVDSKEKTLILRFADKKTLEFKGQETVLGYLDELQTAYREIKEGRVLSEKNRKLVSDCLTSLKSTESALQALVDASEKEPKEVSNSNQVVVIDLAQALRVIDKVAGVALRDLKRKVNGELGIVPEDSRVPIEIGKKEG